MQARGPVQVQRQLRQPVQLRADADGGLEIWKSDVLQDTVMPQSCAEHTGEDGSPELHLEIHAGTFIRFTCGQAAQLSRIAADLIAKEKSQTKTPATMLTIHQVQLDFRLVLNRPS